MTEANIKLYGIDFRNDDTSRFYWRSHGKKLVYDRTTGKMYFDKTVEKKENRHGILGGNRSAYTKDSLYTMLGDRYNLYVRNNKTGKLKQLTHDGKDYASYCYRSKADTVREGNAAGFGLGHI